MTRRKNRTITRLTEWVSGFWDKNYKLLTGATVAAIVLAGSFYTRNPALWWVPFLWLLIGTLILAVFQAARALVKGIISTCVVAVASTMAISTGSMFDPYSGNNLTWGFALWAAWAVCLTVSFLKVSSVSRWGALTWATVGAYIGSAAAAAVSLSLVVATVTGAALLVVLFAGLYWVAPRVKYRVVAPPRVWREDVSDAVTNGAMLTGYSCVLAPHRSVWRKLTRRPVKTGGYLVWADKAYFLVPVFLQQELQTLTQHRRFTRTTGGQYLAYKGEPAGAWLLGLGLNTVPVFTTGGADVRVVLVDVNNANGHEAKLVGVPLPDSNRVVYLGVAPLGALTGEKAGKALFDGLKELEGRFGGEHRALTQRQLVALTRKL